MMRNFGFTLLELLMVLAISMAILVFGTWFSGEHLAVVRANAALSQLQQAIMFSKIQAIELHQAVYLCPSRDQANCGGKWSDGMIIYTQEGKTSILRSYGKLPGQAKLIFKAFSSPEKLVIYPLGLQTQQNGTFVYCARYMADKITRGLVISTTGRLRVLAQDDPYFLKIKEC